MAYFQDPHGGLHYLSEADVAGGGERLLPAGCEPIEDAQALTIQSPAPTLAEVQSSRTEALYAACQAAITAGFASSALGGVNNYPSTLTDQTNQQSVAAAGGGALWCKDGSGAWAFTAHTQVQAQAVCASFVTWLNACQQQLVTLTAQVNASTSIAAAEAIEWSNPPK